LPDPLIPIRTEWAVAEGLGANVGLSRGAGTGTLSYNRSRRYGSPTLVRRDQTERVIPSMETRSSDGS
jgi:hypothetical protein